MENATIKRICLIRNFRSHPVLVLTVAAYNQQLVPALGDRNQMMWRLGFPVRTADIRILMLHRSGRVYLMVERS